MTLKKCFAVCAGLVVSCLAFGQLSGPLPSGKVSDLLQRAEKGERAALYALVAGASQLPVGKMYGGYINAGNIDGKAVEAVDDASATFALAYFYASDFLEGRFPKEAERYKYSQQVCIWATRAFVFKDQKKKLSEEESYQWFNAKQLYLSFQERLNNAQQQECAKEAAAWALK